MLQSSVYSTPRSWYIITPLIAFVIIGGFSVYLELAQSSITSRLAALKTQQETLNAPLEKTDQAEIDAAGLAAVIKAKLRTVENEQLSWAKIVEKIETTVPKLKDSNEPIVDFRSYNGTADGKISVSATSRSGAPDPFADVAFTIRAFASDPAFKNVFVPSITKTLTPEGETILSFSINFEYLKQNF